MKSGSERSRERTLKILEVILWICALASILPLLTAWGARSYLDRVLDTSPAARQEVPTAAPALPEPVSPPAATDPGAVPSELSSPENSSDWSSARLSEFERLRELFSPPIEAILVLPRQNVRIPVFSGVTEVNMTLGAGHLEDTAPLDGEGNIAVTAHRDGSFRVLEDVEIGDTLILQVNGEDRVFKIARQAIVSPDRVDVLDPTPTTTLTLITCYPFYFVGSAPQRYVLQAELQPAGQRVPADAAGQLTRLNPEHTLHAPHYEEKLP